MIILKNLILKIENSYKSVLYAVIYIISKYSTLLLFNYVLL